MNILFLISEREISITGGRFLQTLYRLKDHTVTIASNSEKVLNNCDPRLENVKRILVKPQEFAWTMQQRDKFAKKFINAFHDLYLCDDMKMWKAEAFDDYLWNVSQFVFPQIEGDFDLLLLSVPSKVESPPHFVDEFFTAQIFKAKQQNIPICGIEILPIENMPILHEHIFDYYIVKSHKSLRYLENTPISYGDIFLCDYKPDNYSLETIEDIFKHFLFKTVQPERTALNVVLMNHTQKREELKEIVKVLSELPFKVNLTIGLINYAVKELHEMEIIRDLLMPSIKEYFTKITFCDISDLPQTLISMDCLISLSPMTLFKWCDNYNIPYIVYEDSKNLKINLDKIYVNKRNQMGFEDIMFRLETNRINNENYRINNED